MRSNAMRATTSGTIEMGERGEMGLWSEIAESRSGAVRSRGRVLSGTVEVEP
jgi:hypothetical protein